MASTACSEAARVQGAGSRGRIPSSDAVRTTRVLHLRCRFAGSTSSDTGQSTVEFAVVTAAFLVASLGIGAMWHGFEDGKLVEHALSSASHHIQAASPQAAADVLLY